MKGVTLSRFFFPIFQISEREEPVFYGFSAMCHYVPLLFIRAQTTVYEVNLSKGGVQRAIFASSFAGRKAGRPEDLSRKRREARELTLFINP